VSGALLGRRVLVTGASRGLGAVVAEHVAGAGASVVLVARSEAALEKVAGGLAGTGHEVVVLDAADAEGWARAAGRIAPGGRLDGMVTAAASIGPVGPLGSWEVGEFRAALDLNVTGTLLPVLSLLGPLRAAGGSVVTFSGGGATGPFPRFDAYAASKAAVVRLTENLARDLAPDIRFNSVAPGFVMTDMHRATLDAGPDLVGEEYYLRTKAALEPGGGDPPGPAAALVTFLLSPESAGITGKLVSARWDPWEDEAFRARLREERDFATLRRIDGQFFEAL
jgi:NAD(P)-dependent dehydrogenase (short-subunit alcohol dehydrogenase family)